MTTYQFIKKHKLTEDSVPKLYGYYIDLIAKGKIVEAMTLSQIINKLDVNKTINY